MSSVWQPARLVGMRYFSLIEARSFVLIFSTVKPLASRYWAHRSQQPQSGFLYILTGMPAASTESGKRSEEHTSELQSLMRISYAVFCLKKKKKINKIRCL